MPSSKVCGREDSAGTGILSEISHSVFESFQFIHLKDCQKNDLQHMKRTDYIMLLFLSWFTSVSLLSGAEMFYCTLLSTFRKDPDLSPTKCKF